MSAEVTCELLHSSPVEGMPGWETRLFLITFPRGADASNHSHLAVGIGLVLEGIMISAFDDDPEQTFTAGQSFYDLGSFHRVSRNGSSTEAMKFVIAYTVRTGEPNTVWPPPIYSSEADLQREAFHEQAPSPATAREADYSAERREACSNQAFAASLSCISRMTIVKTSTSYFAGTSPAITAASLSSISFQPSI